MRIPIKEAMMTLNSATYRTSEVSGMAVKGHKDPNYHPILVTSVKQRGGTINLSYFLGRAYTHEADSEAWVASLPLDMRKMLILLPGLHDCQLPEAFGAKHEIKNYITR